MSTFSGQQSPFVFGVALDGGDEIGDQVEAFLQESVGGGEDVSYLVAFGDEAVVEYDRNEQYDNRNYY